MNAAIAPRYAFPWPFIEPEPGASDKSGQKPPASAGPRDDVQLGSSPASFWNDLKASSQFAVNGIIYKRAGAKAQKVNEANPPLASAAQVRLDDPLVIVPGWTTNPDKFGHLVGHLTADGANGGRAVYLKQGQAFGDQDCQQPTAIQGSDKVFVAVFESNTDSPDVSAPQLEQALNTVKASGLEKIDVLGYSMGGLAVRKMLDKGDMSVDQVALLGTANKGSRFGTLSKYIVERDINWAMSLGGLNGSHLPAMDWLRTLDEKNPESNPKLHALNQNLERQMSHASEFISIGSQDIPTPSANLFGRVDGDGLVATSSITLPGLPTKVLEGKGNKHHGNLPHDSDVFATLTEFFNWVQPS